MDKWTFVVTARKYREYTESIQRVKVKFNMTYHEI